jgi:heptaprenyl diphosphate synthase
MSKLAWKAISAKELRAAVDVQSLPPELVAPLDHLFNSRGKQLRGALVLRSAFAGPTPSNGAVREGAIAIELLHLGTLAHDDVIDDGKLRRGDATVGVTFGNRASAFAGGVLVAAAAGLGARHGHEANEAFAKTVSEICEGEMAEVEDLFNADRPVERYLRAISGKTAAGFAFAGWLGAWLAGSSRCIVARTARFGRELGMAFQVLDDMLDLCNSATETGKQRGRDLEQGVYTLPVIHAALGDPLLKRRLGQPVDDEEIDSLVERVIASGGVVRAEEECRDFADNALNAIVDLPKIARDPLHELLEVALEPADRLPLGSELQHARG